LPTAISLPLPSQYFDGSRKYIAAIDSSDQMPGILQKIFAFEEFLILYPSWRGIVSIIL
jgi:trehalose-6-phosphate synthase